MMIPKAGPGGLRARLLALPRRHKRLLQVVVDVMLIWLALWMAFLIRLGPDQLINPFGDYLWLFLAAPATAIPVFIRFGLYRAVLRYLGGNALLTLFNAVSFAALILALVIFLKRPDILVPRTVVFIHWVMSLRSEEHTSELQSRGHLVCRLLLD